jgi:hypothetical protein
MPGIILSFKAVELTLSAVKSTAVICAPFLLKRAQCAPPPQPISNTFFLLSYYTVFRGQQVAHEFENNSQQH